MKTMRYILIVLGLVSVLSVCAQIAQQPTSEFRSTSSMVYTGSSLPSAARNGVVVGVYSPSAKAPSYRPGLRTTVGGDSGWADEDATEGEGDSGTPQNPGEPFPLGDGVVPLALFALAYAVYSVARVYRRKRRV